MRELRKTYNIVRFYSPCLILGYFFTYCQVFLSNFCYALGFVSRYCVNGILPRFFATGKQLPQGYLFKMRIADVFPPRSGFVQQGAGVGPGKAEVFLRPPLPTNLEPFKSALGLTFPAPQLAVIWLKIEIIASV